MDPYLYTIPANTYFAGTKAEANAIAASYATNQANEKRFCITIDSPLVACQDGSVNASFTIDLGIPPFTWSLGGDALPAGLSMSVSSDGRTMYIMGATSTIGTTNHTLDITDSIGFVSQKNLRIEVWGITDGATLPSVQIGVAYSHQLVGSGGSGTYRFILESGTLPDGLTLSDTGLISGTPTTVGTSTFTIRMVAL